MLKSHDFFVVSPSRALCLSRSVFVLTHFPRFSFLLLQMNDRWPIVFLILPNTLEDLLVFPAPGAGDVWKKIVSVFSLNLEKPLVDQFA